MAGQAVAHKERFPTEVFAERVHVEAEQAGRGGSKRRAIGHGGDVHDVGYLVNERPCFRVVMRRFRQRNKGNSETVRSPNALPVEMARVSIVRRSRQRWLIMGWFHVARESIQR